MAPGWGRVRGSGLRATSLATGPLGGYLALGTDRSPFLRPSQQVLEDLADKGAEVEPPRPNPRGPVPKAPTNP